MTLDLEIQKYSAVHHIGGTGIPKIYAKHIIDLLVEFKDTIKVDEKSSSMKLFGDLLSAVRKLSNDQFAQSKQKLYYAAEYTIHH